MNLPTWSSMWPSQTGRGKWGREGYREGRGYRSSWDRRKENKNVPHPWLHDPLHEGGPPLSGPHGSTSNHSWVTLPKQTPQTADDKRPLCTVQVRTRRKMVSMKHHSISPAMHIYFILLLFSTPCRNTETFPHFSNKRWYLILYLDY